MDLLIEPGDSVVLAVREYAPFVEDPSVRRVQKGGAAQRRQPAGQQADPSEAQVERRLDSLRPDSGSDPPPASDFDREIGPIGDSLEAPAQEEDALPAEVEPNEPPEDGQDLET